MLKWKFFPIVPITLPTQTWRRKFLEDCSRSTLWQKPANACTWWVGFGHGEFCAWFVGFAGFDRKHLTLHFLFFTGSHAASSLSTHHCFDHPSGFSTYRIPHLNVASHNQNWLYWTSVQLKMLQNSTTLNELLQYQTEVQRIGEKVIIGYPGGGSW